MNFDRNTHCLCFRSSEHYLIGSENRIDLHINVTNHGEDAYESNLLVKFPPNVHYIKTISSSSITQQSMALSKYLARPTSVLCSAPTPQNDHILNCELGNPLIEQSMVICFLILWSKHIFFVALQCECVQLIVCKG